MLSRLEEQRLALSKTAEPRHRTRLGQYFTPAVIARFMASLFSPRPAGACRLLDAGAGIGSLSAAFLEQWAAGDLCFEHVDVDAFEVDGDLCRHLSENMEVYAKRLDVSTTVRCADFLRVGADWLSGGLFAEAYPRYTHTILNPPYKKMRSDSEHRLALRRVGIETPNLYSAFVAVALTLLEAGGQLVAIVPRSFCSGRYYLPFRRYLLNHAAIRHIHLFGSRDKAFKDDAVLQENIIVRLDRGGEQGTVSISTSTDDRLHDLTRHVYPFEQIVLPDDREFFIHVPMSPQCAAFDRACGRHHSLADIGVSVSTGPVVDFRLREHLRAMPEPGTVPLLYPGHLSRGSAEWPKLGFKKPNAIACNDSTRRWLYPSGTYCLVRRFSAKEEKRRVVATVVGPSAFPNAPLLGFENHLNVFHENRHGLDEPLAHGLAVYLNSTAVDGYFRRFNGHTQVNATDLRLLKYPSREELAALGTWAGKCGPLTQTMIDERVGSITV